VPEAAVDEHCHSTGNEDDVGADPQTRHDKLVIHAEAQAMAMQKRA
jgi:hypothetical protein